MPQAKWTGNSKLLNDPRTMSEIRGKYYTPTHLLSVEEQEERRAYQRAYQKARYIPHPVPPKGISVSKRRQKRYPARTLAHGDYFISTACRNYFEGVLDCEGCQCFCHST